ncbi:PREDICTED: copine-8-like, partial [Priapulus caudatus]|uniref:Copine-8-like n=1 Tax=Priapulus caudatus TaxID=37621 RepID=A0ABM1F2S7_PRICU
HDVIGEFTTTLQRLVKGPGPDNVYECHNTKKAAKKKNYKNSGISLLIANRKSRRNVHHRLLHGGIQLKMAAAIDFTASNEDFIQLTSLHYLNPYQPNMYARVLQAVGEIILDYNRWVNFRDDDPCCDGLEGLLQAYENTLRAVSLFGPTNFAPVINKVAKHAAEVKDGATYYVLVILTDGVVTDMPQTKQAIVQATRTASLGFKAIARESKGEAMLEFDTDNSRLSASGVMAQRDMCQFVAFRDYYASGHNMDHGQAQLAKDILWDIPDQFLAYMKNNNIKPRQAATQLNGSSARVIQQP